MNEIAYRRTSYCHTFSWDKANVQTEVWEIRQSKKHDYCSMSDPVVFRHIVPPNTPDSERWAVEPPLELRREFERLIEYKPGDAVPGTTNIVELIADGECGFDQPCAFGNRVEDHAVYCHCDTWLYAPSKCRRNNTDFPYVECPGFKPASGYLGRGGEIV